MAGNGVWRGLLHPSSMAKALAAGGLACIHSTVASWPGGAGENINGGNIQWRNQ
jgi:hypothetical protein